MKVTFNDGLNVFDLDVSPFGFMAFLVRVHSWYGNDPNFRGVLVTIAGEVILIRPAV
jgi:hypothetical protein